MFATFQSPGRLPVLSEQLNTKARDGASWQANSLRTMGEMLFGPVDLLVSTVDQLEL